MLKLHMFQNTRVTNCTCCKLHMLQIASVVNCTCCKLHVLQIACVSNCTCCKLPKSVCIIPIQVCVVPKQVQGSKIKFEQPTTHLAPQCSNSNLMWCPHLNLKSDHITSNGIYLDIPPPVLLNFLRILCRIPTLVWTFDQMCQIRMCCVPPPNSKKS